MRIVVGFVYYFDFDGLRSQLISLTNDGVASILSFDTRSLTRIMDWNSIFARVTCWAGGYCYENSILIRSKSPRTGFSAN